MVSLLVAVIVAALIFDFINGFHDAANAIATSVSTGVLPMRTAVFVAGLLNIVGAMFGHEVAKTIASGFADPAIVTQQIVMAALFGGVIWNLITWWFGLPSSSSHALIGGLCGAIVGGAGMDAFNWSALVKKVVVPLVASPTAGFLIALIFAIVVTWIVRRMRPAFVHSASRKLQLVSACGMAFSHGMNDAQKAMGVITLALMAYAADGHAHGAPSWIFPDQHAHPPMWVVWSCALAIGFGTMAGGKKIIKTMGAKMLRITPLDGFAAETSGTIVILVASHWGLPISTTHCITSCIMGVGASRRLSAVRWGVAGNILWAWVLTIPASAFFAWLSLLLIHQVF